MFNLPPAWTKRKLPHLTIPGSIYFITWRLRDNQAKLSPEERTLVQATITHFNNQRYTLYAFVVMDDHVHLLVQPHANWSLEKLLHSWKSFSSHQLAHQCQRPTPIWQPERFDRVIRNEPEFLETMSYILGNPNKRWPDIQTYPWVWGLGLDDLTGVDQ